MGTDRRVVDWPEIVRKAGFDPDFVPVDSQRDAVVAFLEGCSVVVAGGRSSGRTTMLRLLRAADQLGPRAWTWVRDDDTEVLEPASRLKERYQQLATLSNAEIRAVEAALRSSRQELARLKDLNAELMAELLTERGKREDLEQELRLVMADREVLRAVIEGFAVNDPAGRDESDENDAGGDLREVM